MWVPACSGHFLATGLRWILQRRASNSLLAPGGFLRNLGFRGVGAVTRTFAMSLADFCSLSVHDLWSTTRMNKSVDFYGDGIA